MIPTDLMVLGFIVIAGVVGACGWGFRCLKRLAGLVIGALAGCLLLGVMGLLFIAWSPPDSSVNAAFRDSPVLRLLTNQAASVGRTLGIDMEKLCVDDYRGVEP